MTEELIVWIVVGLAAGWLASQFLGGGGLLRYLIVGMVGSIVGGFLMSALGINLPIANKWIHDILVATAGAAIVIIIARVIAK